MEPPITSSSGVTQKDIARSLNLSRSTVAQALNVRFQHKLPTETVELIKRKAAELNYYPKRFAKALRQGRAYTIGAVFKLARYYAPHEQMRRLSHTALAAGYHLVTIDRGWFVGKPEEEEKFVLEAGLDGILFHDISLDDPPRWVSILQERNFPMIQIGSDLPFRMDGAWWDIRESFAAITRHHLAQGSKRLALILPISAEFFSEKISNVYCRARGFADAITEAGGQLITPFAFPNGAASAAEGRSGVIGEIICLDEDIQWDGNAFSLGIQIASRLLDRESPPDSLVCANDDMAAGAITVCLDRGVSIPAQVKISGADNAPFSAYSGIPITTIAPPAGDISNWCINRLIARIERKLEPQQIETRHFPCGIHIRRSTAPVPIQI